MKPAAAVGAAADAGDGGAGVDLDAVAVEFGVHQGAEFGIDGRQHLGEHLDLGDGDASGGEPFGHFQADVAGADDESGRGLDPVDAGGQGEGVAHGMQQMHAVVDAEGVEAVDGRPHGHGAGADDQLVVVDHRFAAVSVPDSEALAGDVDGGGEGVETQLACRWLRGRRGCGGRGCASG